MPRPLTTPAPSWAWVMAWCAFFLAFDRTLTVQFALPKLLVASAGLAAGTAVWAHRAARGRVTALPRATAGITAALAVWWTLTTLTAADATTALYGAPGRHVGLLYHLACLAAFVGCATALTPWERHRGVASLVVALVPPSLVALAQVAGFVEHRQWPDARPFATIGHPVILGALLAMAVPSAATFAISAPSPWAKRAWIGVATILASALVTTVSRGPWFGAACGICVAAFGLRREGLARWRAVATVATVGLVAGAALLTAHEPSRRLARERLATVLTSASFENRLVYYSAAASMVRDYPLTGVGFDNFGLRYPAYRPVEPSSIGPDTIPTMVHNGVLHAAVTTGLPGAVLWVLWLAAIALAIWRAARGADDRASRVVAWGALAALVSYVVQDLTGWEDVSLQVTLCVWLGLASGLDPGSRRAWPRGPAGTLAWAMLALTSALLAAALARDGWTRSRADRLLATAELERPPAPLALVDAARALRPADPNVAYRAGMVALRLGDERAAGGLLEEAASALDGAIALNPWDPYALIHRAMVSVVAAQRNVPLPPAIADGSRRAETLALVLDPNNATVHDMSARLRLALGDVAGARTAVRRARELRPADPKLVDLERVVSAAGTP